MTIQNVRVKLVRSNEIDLGVDKIKSPLDSVKLLRRYLDEFCSDNRENCILIGVDTKHNPTIIHHLSIGTLDRAMFSAEDIYRPILLSNSAGFILAHNHPTGDCTPSSDDIKNYERVKQISEAIGVYFIDCIVFSDCDYFSFLENNSRVDELLKA